MSSARPGLITAFAFALLLACGSRGQPHDPSLTASRVAPSPDDAAAVLAPSDGSVAASWKARPPETFAMDDHVLHDGHPTVRLMRDATSPAPFSNYMTGAPLDFTGATVELRGYLRTEDVRGRVGLWMREDGDRPDIEFDNMAEHPLAGTNEWASYSIQLPVSSEATSLVWGVLLEGQGTVWADSLSLYVDGKPIAQAPRAKRVQTALERDHQFDHGSGIASAQPSAMQIDNLVTLAKVWGFLKYHHPAITSGTRHWDYELLRVMPAIVTAPDRETANAALVHWIEGLGPVVPCKPCAKLPADGLALTPDLAWLDDRARLGPELAGALRAVYGSRVPDQQFYVSLEMGVGNPQFHHEPGYDHVALPDAGFQLLGLFRFWNLVEYWAPDRALADAPWDRVLTDAVPEVMAATSPDAYKRAMLRAIARQRDGHAGLAGAMDSIPPQGPCRLPIAVRFVEGRPVVSAIAPGDAAGLEVGDELVELDGEPVAQLVARWAPFYSASNDAARRSVIASMLPRGECEAAALAVRRAGRMSHVAMTRTKSEPLGPRTHDLPGPTFRLLSPDVAYVKLSSVVAADADKYVTQAAGTKGLIVDIRNYPSQFVVFALGQLLVDKPTSFVTLTTGDLSNPGAFAWSATVELAPAQPHYAGKVVVLVDETSMSQSEYTAMALRASPRATVIGVPTAGADGNVSPYALPGGLQTALSGIGIFYPDRRPTQGVGIVPDQPVAPTIAGIRAGRDEGLEAGIRAIVGPRVSAAEVQRLAKPPSESAAAP